MAIATPSAMTKNTNKAAMIAAAAIAAVVAKQQYRLDEALENGKKLGLY